MGRVVCSLRETGTHAKCIDLNSLRLIVRSLLGYIDFSYIVTLKNICVCVRTHIYVYICMCTVVHMCVYRYVDLNADDMYERILDRPRLHPMFGIGRTTLSCSLIAD